jgi:hypothetical protein
MDEFSVQRLTTIQQLHPQLQQTQLLQSPTSTLSKMQITATLAALCASIALVSAQNHGGATSVDFCNSANYEGCTTQASKSAACVNVTPGVEGQGSVRPQKGSFCYFFT